jgi:ribosomal-protein-alanine N-acetyltransferase
MMLTWFPRDDTPVLTGKRVTLRGPRLSDYEEWRDLRKASREFLKPYEPRWTEADLSQRVFAARVRRGWREARAGTDYSFLIFDHQQQGEPLVGGVTLSNVRRRAAQFANLGYWMGQHYAGRGLMTEAVTQVIDYAFETLGLHRIHAAFLPGNIASRRVLEKNGFQEEGYAENYLQIDGKWADHVLFGLTRERWDSRRLGRRGTLV